MQELIDGLRRGGLVGHNSLTGHSHLSAAGRKARKEVEDPGAEKPRERRVAVLGTSGIDDAGLRDIFETPDPLPGDKLLPKARKSGKSRTYGDIPPTRICQCSRGYRAAGDARKTVTSLHRSSLSSWITPAFPAGRRR